MHTDIKCTLRIIEPDDRALNQMRAIHMNEGTARFERVTVESLIESLRLAPKDMLIPIMHDGSFGIKIVFKKKKEE